MKTEQLKIINIWTNNRHWQQMNAKAIQTAENAEDVKTENWIESPTQDS